MTNTTNLFTQNWKVSAADETRGYVSNFRNFQNSKAIRLQHIGLANLPRVAHVRLYVQGPSGEFENLWDGDVASDHSAYWNGSLILRNAMVISVGAQVYGLLENDIMYLRIIWEEIE